MTVEYFRDAHAITLYADEHCCVCDGNDVITVGTMPLDVSEARRLLAWLNEVLP